jgi:uncharacterized SAM-binding protein YcdF (DUF218 family)
MLISAFALFLSVVRIHYSHVLNVQRDYYVNKMRFFIRRSMVREVDLALILWNYLKLNHDLRKADAIIVFGNHDLLTALRGIELYNANLAPLLVFTGGQGRVTENLWEETEAQKYSKIAIVSGVDKRNIRIEEKSTNTGENIIFTKTMLEEEKIVVKSVISVHKPYMERRTYAAMQQFWPEIEVMVSSSKLSFTDYLHALTMQGFSEKHTIEMIVGDFQRIDLYAKKGYQTQQRIPQCAWEAYGELVRLGYNKYVLQ